ncbi:Tetratricopeptide TPR_2 repeat protein [Methanocaldococcus lauensis]|nr:Tetratricopeptide TPR_2 repeat protein [Methanocaldococcus lauensis]
MDTHTKEFPRVRALEATTYLLKCYRELFEGDLLKALYYIDRALELEPDFRLALFLKGLILNAIGEINKAIDTFEKLVNYGSKNPIVWVFLGQSYGLLGRCDKAFSCYKNALGTENKFLAAFLLKLICTEFLGDYEEALKSCDELLTYAPRFVPIWVKKADILRKLGKYDDALLCLKKALELKPNDKNALYLMGVLLKRMGKFKESLECFKKLIDELGVRLLDAIRHAVSVALIVGDLETAERYIKMGLDIREDDVYLWYYKGELYERLGKSDEALKYYKKALSLYPYRVDILLSIARIYERLGDVKKAVEYYNKAIECRDRSIEK